MNATLEELKAKKRLRELNAVKFQLEVISEKLTWFRVESNTNAMIKKQLISETAKTIAVINRFKND